MSSSVSTLARASRLASAIASARASRTRPPLNNPLKYRPTASRRAEMLRELGVNRNRNINRVGHAGLLGGTLAIPAGLYTLKPAPAPATTLTRSPRRRGRGSRVGL